MAASPPQASKRKKQLTSRGLKRITGDPQPGHYHEMEDALYKEVCTKRSLGLPADKSWLKSRAKELVGELYAADPGKVARFRASDHWQAAFRKRFRGTDSGRLLGQNDDATPLSKVWARRRIMPLAGHPANAAEHSTLWHA
eukprot:jgi/Mesvir1/1082/Mv17595-RA.1